MGVTLWAPSPAPIVGVIGYDPSPRFWPHLPAHALHHGSRARPDPLRSPAPRRGACPPASAPAAGGEGWQALYRYRSPSTRTACTVTPPASPRQAVGVPALNRLTAWTACAPEWPGLVDHG